MDELPTPEEFERADYLQGWRDGRVVKMIRDQYEHRATTITKNHIMCVLDRDSFFAGMAPLMDLAAGPSTHVGWNLRRQFVESSLYFTDWNPTALSLHQRLYKEIVSAETMTGRYGFREYWMLGDPHKDPYLLREMAVIVHGSLPRLRDGEQVIEPDTPETMSKTLDGLLRAHPARLALYFYKEGHPQFPDNARLALAALDHLCATYGTTYRCFDSVDSADFRPQPGGTLILVTP
jgi:hypothetical protein